MNSTKKRKSSLILALILTLSVFVTTAGATYDAPKLYDDSRVIFPNIRNQAVRLLEADIQQPIPLRAAVESCGGTVSWDNGTIGIQHENMIATIVVGKDTAVINGVETELQFIPTINDQNRTVVSYDFLRPIFVSENDEYADIKDYVIPLLYNVIDTYDIAGMTLSIVDLDGEESSWNQGFGFADFENAVATTEDTLFEIGSISKTFTGLGIMQLKEQGKLSLDTPITRYISNFSIAAHPERGGSSSDITLRMIGNHTSGIQGSIYPYFMTYDQGASTNKFNSIVSDLSKSNLAAAPGDTQAYSNTAFALMGAVLAQVANPGMSYLDGFLRYMDENVFGKMGMESTSFIQDSEALMSKGYATLSEGAQKPLYISQVPAGNVVSSSNDMAKYIETLLSGGKYEGVSVLSKSSVTEMLTPRTVDSNRYTLCGEEMGFVWMTADIGKTIMQHGGNTIYFNSMLAMDPDTGLGAFLSCNTAGTAALVNAYCNAILKEAIEQKTGVTLVPDTYPETKAVTLTADELLPYTGLYSYTSTFADLSDEGMLTVNIAGTVITLSAQDDGSFLDQYGNRYRYHILENGIAFSQYVGTDLYYICDVINPPSAENFSKFDGTWKYLMGEGDDYMAGMLQSLTLTSDSGYPCITQEGQTIPLACVDENTSYIPGYGRDMGNTIDLVEADGVTYLRFGGALFSKAEDAA